MISIHYSIFGFPKRQIKTLIQSVQTAFRLVMKLRQPKLHSRIVPKHVFIACYSYATAAYHFVTANDV